MLNHLHGSDSIDVRYLHPELPTQRLLRAQEMWQRLERMPYYHEGYGAWVNILLPTQEIAPSDETRKLSPEQRFERTVRTLLAAELRTIVEVELHPAGISPHLIARCKDFVASSTHRSIVDDEHRPIATIDERVWGSLSAEYALTMNIGSWVELLADTARGTEVAYSIAMRERGRIHVAEKRRFTPSLAIRMLALASAGTEEARSAAHFAHVLFAKELDRLLTDHDRVCLGEDLLAIACATLVAPKRAWERFCQLRASPFYDETFQQWRPTPTEVDAGSSDLRPYIEQLLGLLAQAWLERCGFVLRPDAPPAPPLPEQRRY